MRVEMRQHQVGGTMGEGYQKCGILLSLAKAFQGKL